VSRIAGQGKRRESWVCSSEEREPYNTNEWF